MLANFWLTSADHHLLNTYNIEHLGLFQYVIAFPAAIRRQLGLLVWNRVKYIDIKIYNQNCLSPSPGTKHILINLSTFDTSIRVIYICWYITHRFKTPVTVQKIKVEHSCSYLAVFTSDIKWCFCTILIETPLISNCTMKLQIQSKSQLPSFRVISRQEWTTLRDKPETFATTK